MIASLGIIHLALWAKSNSPIEYAHKFLVLYQSQLQIALLIISVLLAI